MINQRRVVIDQVKPQINCGEHPIKRVIGEIVNVNAHVLADGHDILGASVLYKNEGQKKYKEVRLHHVVNDEWEGSFVIEDEGITTYKVQAWVDYGLTWQHGIERKIEDGQNVKSELLEGVEILNRIKSFTPKDIQAKIEKLTTSFKDSASYTQAVTTATSEELHQILYSFPEKHLVNETKELRIIVDRKKAAFSTWYEFFPRSSSAKPDVHGTFKDCERLLPGIAKMGFDTLYFPPIHPIGEVNRKGKNNTTTATEGDVGSAWGIGSKHGGHKDIHPDLGNLEDFKSLIKSANDQGIEIAMDYALQAAPDHPWVKEHPEWFKWRPDGTVQYAENPPKKYQDILPIYWESEDYENLWKECLDILLFWIDCGIKFFRVDNPHTKPFYFWNWVISEVKKKHPDVLFLAEAFTRPKIMARLAKEGFTQSYTYFTWRDSKHELIEYMTELTQSELKEYMRPNFWPNTPDINPYHLQGANESKYIQRYVLAATLSGNIGIYGPVFEQMISEAIPGKEEYYMSEKFQIYNYEWDKENKLIRIITKVNELRKNHPALQQTNNIKFCDVHNDRLIAYYKYDHDKGDQLLIIVNLDHYYTQSGTVQLPLKDLGRNPGDRVEVRDLITGSSYQWYAEWNYVELHPSMPFHIFKILT